MADWWDASGITIEPQTAPAAAPDPSPFAARAADPGFDASINGLYQQHYGRDATPEELLAHAGNPGGIGAVADLFGPSAAAQTAPAQTVQNTTPVGYSTPQYQAPQYASAGPYVAPAAYSGPAPLSALPTYTLPTQSDVEQTPGYQFTRDQGIHGVTSSDIARGTGLGGAALKDIAGYTTGLADSYYGNRVSQGMAANQLNANNVLNVQNSNLAGAGQQFNAGLASANSANSFNLSNAGMQNTFGLTNAQNQFNSNLAGMGQQLGAQQQYWKQGFDENRNAFDQYNTTQTNAFDQWYKLAQLGNPGNPYT